MCTEVTTLRFRVPHICPPVCVDWRYLLPWVWHQAAVCDIVSGEWTVKRRVWSWATTARHQRCAEQSIKDWTSQLSCLASLVYCVVIYMVLVAKQVQIVSGCIRKERWWLWLAYMVEGMKIRHRGKPASIWKDSTCLQNVWCTRL